MRKNFPRLGHTIPMVKLIAVILLLSSLSFSRGGISGILTYNGKPVNNALIKLYSSGKLVKQKRTNYRGAFTFWNVKNGLYHITIVKSGYKNYHINNIVIDGVIMPTEVKYPNIILSKPQIKSSQYRKPKSTNTIKPKIQINDKRNQARDRIKTKTTRSTSPPEHDNSQSGLYFYFFIIILFILYIKAAAKVTAKKTKKEANRKAVAEAKATIEANAVVTKAKKEVKTATKSKIKPSTPPKPKTKVKPKTKPKPAAKTKAKAKTSVQKKPSMNYMKNWYGKVLKGFRKLDYGRQYTLLRKLGSGRKVLTTKSEFNAYMAAYGSLHYSRYKFVFNKLLKGKTKLKKQNISIVDWGCGMGIGTYILLEELEKAGFSKRVSSCIFIDASKKALTDARNKIFNDKGSFNFNFLDLYTKNKDLKEDGEFDDIFKGVIKNISNKRIVKIHIFGNLLDVPGIQIESIYKTIIKTFKGENYFVCSSPMSTGGAKDGISKFLNYFKHKFENKIVIEFDNYFSGERVSYYSIRDQSIKKSSGDGYLALFNVKI